MSDSKPLRRAALVNKVPYFTTMAGSRRLPREAIQALEQGELQVRPLQSYFG